MQKQVHEESNLVAKQHIGAVEGAAGTCQVVGVCSSTEGSNRQMKKIINQLWKKKKKKKKKKPPDGSHHPSRKTWRKNPSWDVNVWPWALTRLSAVIRKPNTLLYICGSLRVQFVFASQKHISLTVRARKTIWGIKTLISATYVETPLSAATFGGAWAQSQSHLGWDGAAFPLER